jgi:hypothetical protein
MRCPKWDLSFDPTTKIRVNCKVFDLEGKIFYNYVKNHRDFWFVIFFFGCFFGVTLRKIL